MMIVPLLEYMSNPWKGMYLPHGFLKASPPYPPFNVEFNCMLFDYLNEIKYNYKSLLSAPVQQNPKDHGAKAPVHPVVGQVKP